MQVLCTKAGLFAPLRHSVKEIVLEIQQSLMETERQHKHWQRYKLQLNMGKKTVYLIPKPNRDRLRLISLWHTIIKQYGSLKILDICVN